MSVRSIIDISVNDDQFKAFHDLFTQYQSKLDEMPDSWKKVSGATGKSKAEFVALTNEAAKSVNHAAKMVNELNRATKAQKEFHTATRGAGAAMKRMANDAKSLSKSIFGLGSYLMKLSAMGLAGAGAGLFGLDALGRSAVGGQREARGLGITQGQMRAFKTDFGRYVDPNMLSNVAAAQGDLSKRAYLALASGVSYDQAGSMTADQLTMNSSQRLHDWWNKTPEAMRSEQTLKAGGFSQIGYTMEDARRLGAASQGELNSAKSQYSQDSKTLAISDKNTAAWYELTRNLTLAGQTIETVLINKLQKLAPALGGLTDKIAKDLAIMINGISEKDMDDFANGIKSAAQYLGSPEFMDKLKNFGEAIGDVTDFILKTAAFFGGGSSSSVKNTPYIPAAPVANGTSPLAAKQARLSMLESKFNLPKGSLDSMWLQESSRGKNAGMSSAGALGDFQFMPWASKSFDRTDFNQSSFGAGKLMAENMQLYHGDFRKALAAYNWGTKGLDSDIKRHGNDWERYAPKETQNYINQIVSRVKSPTVNVTITNKTGADVSVSTHAMAR